VLGEAYPAPPMPAVRIIQLPLPIALINSGCRETCMKSDRHDRGEFSWRRAVMVLLATATFPNRVAPPQNPPSWLEWRVRHWTPAKPC